MSNHLLSSALISALLLSGCGDDGDDATPEPITGIVQGASGTLATGTVSTWAELDAGVVTRVGASIAAATVDSATDRESVSVAFPAQAIEQTFFNHFGANFEAEGHDPPPYLVAHFDLHFYGIDETTRLAIDCEDEALPDGVTANVPASGNDYLPDNYLIPSPALDPDGTCVPEMGVHAINVTSPELAPEDAPAFTATQILGFHAGNLAFIEPMIALDHLKEKPAISWEVPQPAKLGRSVLWPARFTADYNDADATYDLVYSEFTASE